MKENFIEELRFMYIGQENMVSVENISIPTKLLNIKNVRFIILL